MSGQHGRSGLVDDVAKATADDAMFNTLSPAQLHEFANLQKHARFLHRRWRDILAEADCEEIIADAIVRSQLLRAASDVSVDLTLQWWRRDVRHFADKRRDRVQGAVRKDGTRRGAHASLNVSVTEGGDELIAMLRADPASITDPEELVTEGPFGESTTYFGRQARLIVDAALTPMKPKHREVILAEASRDGRLQRFVAADLGMTVATYETRLKAAAAEFGKHVRAQKPTEHCDAVRRLLGGPLGHNVALVESHLADCLCCRRWQLFHRPAAAAVVIPFPLLTRWDVLTSRLHGLITRATPIAEGATGHGEALAGTGAGVAGTASGAVLASGTAKVAAVVCISALTCTGIATTVARQDKPDRTADTKHATPRPRGNGTATTALPASGSAGHPSLPAPPAALATPTNAPKVRPSAKKVPRRRAGLRTATGGNVASSPTTAPSTSTPAPAVAASSTAPVRAPTPAPSSNFSGDFTP